MPRAAIPIFFGLLLAACAPAPQAAIDPALLDAIGQIKAIDNHAHPVRFTSPSEPADRYFDALPVDNMEPQSDPLALRPNAPDVVEAWRTLYNFPFSPDNLKRKQQLVAQQGASHPEKSLDAMGTEIMMANRVEMGASIQPPRFRWVPYADALLFPLDNSALAVNSDRKSFFALEDKLRARYLTESGLAAIPRTLDEYLSKVVKPTLERHRQGGAVAEKFEAAYLRTLAFDAADRASAARIYESKAALAQSAYKPLQDFLFRYIAAECGRLGLAVHIHTNAGAGGYFDIAGANPLNLEPLFDDPSLRKTKFVMLHGGWPFLNEITALMTKPNAYLDFSNTTLLLSPATLAPAMRQWLEFVPEKILYASDAYPFSDELGWEESGWIGSHKGRETLALALTAMMRDGAVTRDRALQLAHMVLHDNAKALYNF